MKNKAQIVSGSLAGIVNLAGIAIIVIGLLTSAFKVIDPGKVGVQVLFGKVQDEVLESGLHVINPLVEVTTFSIQTENYTMSAKSNEGQTATEESSAEAR